MKWHTEDETPHIFYDVVVKEQDKVYTRHIDYCDIKINALWVYAHDLVRVMENYHSLLRALLQELDYEASSSEDLGTRKKLDALCELIRLKLKED